MAVLAIGLTPIFPIIAVLPVFVTPAFARITKLPADPRSTGAAARLVAGMAVAKKITAAAIAA